MINVWRCEKDKSVFILTDKPNLDGLPEEIAGFGKNDFIYWKSLANDAKKRVALEVEQAHEDIAEHGYHVARADAKILEILGNAKLGQ